MKYKASSYFTNLVVRYQKYGQFSTPIIRVLTNNMEIIWKNIPKEDFYGILKQLTDKTTKLGQEPYHQCGYSDECITALGVVRKLYLQEKTFIRDIITQSLIDINDDKLDEIGNIIKSIVFNHVFTLTLEADKDTILYRQCFWDSTTSISQFESKESNNSTKVNTNSMSSSESGDL